MAAENTLTSLHESAAGETPTALPPELHPNIEHIVTEDDTPVDSIFSEKQQRLFTEPLYSSWNGPDAQQRYVALANVGLFFGIRKPPYVPDMLLSLDVELPSELWPKRNRSYFVWEYGKPPEVVIEIVSNREGDEDAGKLTGYANVGVKYYVIFDPEKLLSDRSVRAYQLEATNYRELSEPFWFSGVSLGLRLWTGPYEGRRETWLRWVGGDGQLIPTGAERAEQEKKRADRMAEQLRRLGHEPDG